MTFLDRGDRQGVSSTSNHELKKLKPQKLTVSQQMESLETRLVNSKKLLHYLQELDEARRLAAELTRLSAMNEELAATETKLHLLSSNLGQLVITFKSVI